MSASPSPSPPSPSPPDDIFSLKKILTDLKTELETPKDHQKFDDLNKEVKYFFSTAYSASTHTAPVLADNEKKIKSIEAFDTRYSTFVTLCDTYVNSAKAIFGDLDGLITSSIKVDESFYTEIKDKIPELIKPITNAINALKHPVPDATSSPLTDIQLEKNAHLEKLNEFLKTMMTELIASINTEVETEFSDAEIKKIVESDPSHYDDLLSDQINKIYKKLLEYLNEKEKNFDDLLKTKSSKNTSVNIIVDTTSIVTPLNKIMKELRKQFAESGGNAEDFFTILKKFYLKEITKLIEAINIKVVALDPVPVMADPTALASPGGGGGGGDGNGNASTLATLATLDTYPVSNKSQKNRNKGKSKGKGKGKGKIRKPNATKKNNRR